jgi:hypothetical protein
VLPVGLKERRLVDTEGNDWPHACWVVNERPPMSLDGVHDSPPAHPELVGNTGDRPCQLAHLAAGLDAGAAGEQRPRRHVNGALLPGLDWALHLPTTPAPLGPHQACRSPEAGEVSYVHADAVLALGHHATAPTPRHRGGRLDRDDKLVLALGGLEHLDAMAWLGAVVGPTIGYRFELAVAVRRRHQTLAQPAPTSDGRILKLLNVINEYRCECLAIVVERSIDADDVVRCLDRLAAEREAPRYLRFDASQQPRCVGKFQRSLGGCCLGWEG